MFYSLSFVALHENLKILILNFWRFPVLKALIFRLMFYQSRIEITQHDNSLSTEYSFCYNLKTIRK